ncbi:MAG: bifunctional DNA primase/polymerase [Planctomycetota bacterium]|nr:bifunctional DNA primase/polymerase [Planctomycetota bacterium]
MSEADCDLSAWAVKYAELGLYVLPLWGVRDGMCMCPGGEKCKPGKHPLGRLVPHGKHNAPNDPKVVRAWWDREPQANIGIATGPSGLFAVDIDPRNDGDVSWERLIDRHGRPPDTWVSETGGGGWHYIFRRPTEIPARDLKPLPGIEIKAGGHIVAPPSLHVSGKRYVWQVGSDPTDGAPLADPPPWLIALVTGKPSESRDKAPPTGYVYNPRADAPNAFRQLLDTDLVLRGIWTRDQKPEWQTDTTPSGWCNALLLTMKRHQLPAQDVGDTLVAYRARYPDDPKDRKWFEDEVARYVTRTNGRVVRNSPPVGLLKVAPGEVESLRAVDQALRHAELLAANGAPASECLLLVRLARYANDDGLTWPSQQRLAREMGLSPTQVSKLVSSLCARGCIEKARHSAPGTNNVYRLHIREPHPHHLK